MLHWKRLQHLKLYCRDYSVVSVHPALFVPSIECINVYMDAARGIFSNPPTPPSSFSTPLGQVCCFLPIGIRACLESARLISFCATGQGQKSRRPGIGPSAHAKQKHHAQHTLWRGGERWTGWASSRSHVSAPHVPPMNPCLFDTSLLQAS